MRCFNAAITMFVFLRGRSVIEYCFGLQDAYRAANDACSGQAEVIGLPRRRAPSARRK